MHVIVHVINKSCMWSFMYSICHVCDLSC